MNEPMNDGVLKAAAIIILIFRTLMWIAFGALLILLPVLWIYGGNFDSEILKAGADSSDPMIKMMISVVMAGAAAVIFLFIRFLTELQGIVASVGQGDPFARENARRLRRMAWLALAMEVGAVLLGLIGLWAAAYSDKIDIDFDFSVTGILLILLLFVLARVFERGADMREEIEATV